MMRERGYVGPIVIRYSEATRWLLDKYHVWLVVSPRYVTPLDDDDAKKTLMWELEARSSYHEMAGDGYCAYVAIHQEDNPCEARLEQSDVYGVEVYESNEKYYKSPEEAFSAGLIRTMLWVGY